MDADESPDRHKFGNDRGHGFSVVHNYRSNRFRCSTAHSAPLLQVDRMPSRKHLTDLVIVPVRTLSGVSSRQFLRPGDQVQ